MFAALQTNAKISVEEFYDIKFNSIAAISVGIVNNEITLDLNYEEDSSCETDMNFVMTEDGGLIEVQGTAEDGSFSPDQLMKMLSYAQAGINDIIELQHQHINGD